MKNIKVYIVGLAMAAFASACSVVEVEQIPDLNNPTLESVLSNATSAQISQLGVGVQSVMRNNYGDMSTIGGSIGRECVIFAKTDNRYYTELQGQAPIDAAGIMLPWYGGFNATRRRAEIFLRSAQNTTSLNAAEKSACVGFAKTVQAFVMLNCLNMMGETGIRTTFTDLLAKDDMLKPGAFVTYTEGLAACKKLADEGLAALGSGGAAFPFPMGSGWTAAFSTPAGFAKFNRAIAARIAMYQKDWAGMNTALTASFLDVNGALTTGPNFTYSTTAGDATNPLFQPLEESNRPTAVQKNFVAEAEAGDTRVFGTSIREGGKAKIRKRTATVSLGGFPASEYEQQQYATNTSSINIIRNEELILMSAEAKAQTNDLAGALVAVNKIRTAHGLAASTAATQAALITEILKQRRYSLFMEGSHRWFDMRRYGLLAQLPKDLATHQVWDKFPKPQNEVDWDSKNK
jgi:starch-binding outer membrane protein, SusD/RagB family